MEEISEVTEEKSATSNSLERPRVIEPDKSLGRYIIDEFKTKASASKDVPYESIDLDLYKPKAKLAAFKTSEDRINFWIQTLIVRYVDYFGQKEGYSITWEELESTSQPGKPDKVKVSVTKDREKFFVISVFVTTGRIQVQGHYYDLWSTTEFPLCLRLVNYFYQVQHDETLNAELTTLSQQNIFSYSQGKVIITNTKEGDMNESDASSSNGDESNDEDNPPGAEDSDTAGSDLEQDDESTDDDHQIGNDPEYYNDKDKDGCEYKGSIEKVHYLEIMDKKAPRKSKTCHHCGKSVTNLSRHKMDVHRMSKLRTQLDEYVSGNKNAPKKKVKFCPQSPCKCKVQGVFQLKKHLQSKIHGTKPNTNTYLATLRNASRARRLKMLTKISRI